MKDTPENRVKKSIEDALRADGWFVQYNPQYGPFVVKGRPDMEAYRDGKEPGPEDVPAPGAALRAVHPGAVRRGYQAVFGAAAKFILRRRYHGRWLD